ncbi:MAG: FmdB family transcriptional regulator [Actinomycetota bacterium]|nr:FmdB family transcriptional regulator [Actinomycetota bacterium]
MPTYEYACRDCGEHVEVFQSFTEAPLTACGLCGGRLRKVFGAAGIIFKGSGYYVTDSRKKPSEPAAASSEKKAEPGKKEETGKKAAAGAGDKAQPAAESA